MEVATLKSMIKSKSIPNFMIFTGDEWLIQKVYIAQIARVKELDVVYADSILDIIDKMSTKSLFSANHLYVLRDDRDLISEEKIYTNLTEKVGKNTLILVLNSVDKRLKIVKMYSDTLFEFKPLNEAVLKQYIQKEINLSAKNCDILMEICEYNYGRCLLEIDKVRQYYSVYEKDDPRTPTIDTLFTWLIEDGTIYVPPRDNLWIFIKAVLQNKMSLAFELLNELKELKVPIMSILYNLYTQTKQVLQVQTCTSTDVVKTTGLSTWQVHNARECVGIYSNEDLEYIMRLVQKVESGIKRGLIDEAIALDYVLVSI